PAPLLHFFWRKNGVQDNADGCGKHDGDLLAAGLPAYVETFVAGCGDFGKIDGDAAEFHAGGKALQQAADDYEQRRDETDCGVAGHEGDGENADGHQAQGEKQAGAATVAVGVGTEDERAEG